DDLALVRAGIGTNADVIYQRHARFSLCGAVLARVTRRPFFLEYNASEAFTGKYWNKTPLTRQLARCERAVLATASRIFEAVASTARSQRASCRVSGVLFQYLPVNASEALYSRKNGRRVTRASTAPQSENRA